MSENLNAGTEAAKLLEENAGSILSDTSLSDSFLALSSQVRETEAKINKRDLN